MKKIINKKTYNTETAIEIASWDNNRSRTDFDFCEEVLYKTKRGDYFLYGEGGAATMYAKYNGLDSTYGSWNIIPYSENDAKKWLEERDKTEAYIAEFGERR